MAMKDFKEYLLAVQSQVLEMKQDLSDFDKALKDGYITEDRLEEVKAETEKIEINYQRLLYISYLLAQPQRKSKVPKYKKANQKLEASLIKMKADKDAVISENKDALDNLKTQLKEFEK